jgi:hypothetical protein
MRLVRNTGGDRVADIVRPHLGDGTSIDAVSPALSIFGFGELIGGLNRAPASRLVCKGSTNYVFPAPCGIGFTEYRRAKIARCPRTLSKRRGG